MDSANNKPPDTGQTKGATMLNTTNLSHATTHAARNAMSSAPPTPSMRKASLPATSPRPRESSPRPPQALRRTSSSQSLNKLPASPQLMRKASRASLGSTPDGKERRPTPKRSISNLIAGLREAQSTMESIEEPVPLAAADIAANHFSRELLRQSSADSDAETVVMLHDACYGHRYSRLKATKTTLSMIVERPERLHASVLGTSTAYVRLGEHHAGGKRAPHPDYKQIDSPPFTVTRSVRSLPVTSTFVTNVHGTSWMLELQGMCRSAPEKLAAGAKELSRESTNGQPEKQKLHEGDLYLAPESLEAFQGALGGVADAVDAVFAPESKTCRAFVAVRPPGHHCSADLPSGFCWLNNVHVGIEYAAQSYGLTHAAILDFDLHHGDGSQSITWQRNSKNNEKRMNTKPNNKLRLGPDIGYYSIHDINSYPCEMGDDEKVQAASLCIENAHGQSIWNVHLQPWKTEDEFWRLYEERYSILLEKAKNFLQHHDHRVKSEGKTQPRSAIFISAGFDASEWEGSGMQRHKVNVPTEFYARITQDIVRLAQSLPNCGGRVISVLEGGYSDRALCTGILSHLSGLCVSPVTTETDGVDSLMQQMNGLAINGLRSDPKLHYNKEWWSAENMTALENQVNPPPPPQAKKGRNGPQPTYATPTESFAYKVVDPQKFARSVSGTMREGQAPVRPPTPPPPEVDWVVATQELSKLLIPTERQTKSCTPEELAVARTKKEYQSATATLTTEPAVQPRQLRDRKAKGPTYAESAHSDETGNVRAVSRAESRSSRRETIDVLPTEGSAATSSRRLSRRLSAASALSTTNSTVATDPPPVPKLPPARAAASAVAGGIKPPQVPVPQGQPYNPKTRLPSKARPAVSSMSAIPADVDNLTSGMKKVTLKVSTSKEEHDRKQKEKLDAERRARALKGAETRRVNAAAKKAAKEAVTQPAAENGEALLQAPVPSLLETATVASSYAMGPSASITEAATHADQVKPESDSNTVLTNNGTTVVSGSNQFISSKSLDSPTNDAVVARQGTAALPLVGLHAGPEPSTAIPAKSRQSLTHTSNTGSDNNPLSLQSNTNHTEASAASPISRPVPTLQSSSLGSQLDTPDVAPTPTAEMRLPVNKPSSVGQPSSTGNLPLWSSTGPIPFANPPNTEPA